MNSKHAQRVAANVRAELARQQVTQAQLAGRLNLSRTAVFRRTAGHVAFDISELCVVAEVLNLSVGELVGEVERSQDAQAAAAS